MRTHTMLLACGILWMLCFQERLYAAQPQPGTLAFSIPQRGEIPKIFHDIDNLLCSAVTVSPDKDEKISLARQQELTFYLSSAKRRVELLQAYYDPLRQSSGKAAKYQPQALGSNYLPAVHRYLNQLKIHLHDSISKQELFTWTYSFRQLPKAAIQVDGYLAPLMTSTLHILCHLEGSLAAKPSSPAASPNLASLGKTVALTELEDTGYRVPCLMSSQRAGNRFLDEETLYVIYERYHEKCQNTPTKAIRKLISYSEDRNRELTQLLWAAHKHALSIEQLTKKHKVSKSIEILRKFYTDLVACNQEALFIFSTLLTDTQLKLLNTIPKNIMPTVAEIEWANSVVKPVQSVIGKDSHEVTHTPSSQSEAKRNASTNFGMATTLFGDLPNRVAEKVDNVGDRAIALFDETRDCFHAAGQAVSQGLQALNLPTTDDFLIPHEKIHFPRYIPLMKEDYSNYSYHKRYFRYNAYLAKFRVQHQRCSEYAINKSSIITQIAEIRKKLPRPEQPWFPLKELFWWILGKDDAVSAATREIALLQKLSTTIAPLDLLTDISSDDILPAYSEVLATAIRHGMRACKSLKNRLAKLNTQAGDALSKKADSLTAHLSELTELYQVHKELSDSMTLIEAEQDESDDLDHKHNAALTQAQVSMEQNYGPTASIGIINTFYDNIFKHKHISPHHLVLWKRACLNTTKSLYTTHMGSELFKKASQLKLCDHWQFESMKNTAEQLALNSQRLLTRYAAGLTKIAAERESLLKKRTGFGSIMTKFCAIFGVQTQFAAQVASLDQAEKDLLMSQKLHSKAKQSYEKIGRWVKELTPQLSQELHVGQQPPLCAAQLAPLAKIDPLFKNLYPGSAALLPPEVPA